MSQHYDIDRKRVYLCGFSLGGMMTYHCINVASDIFAAFASASGYRLNEYMPVYTCKRRVPIMHLHGKDDGFVVYNNLQPLINNWVKVIGANPEPEVTEKPGVYTRRHYKPLEGGYEFDFYSLDGYGHEYKNTENFNESDVIWNFLRRYSLDTPAYGTTDVKSVAKKNQEAKVKTVVNAEGQIVDDKAKGLVFLCMDNGNVLKVYR